MANSLKSHASSEGRWLSAGWIEKRVGLWPGEGAAGPEPLCPGLLLVCQPGAGCPRADPAVPASWLPVPMAAVSQIARTRMTLGLVKRRFLEPATCRGMPVDSDTNAPELLTETSTEAVRDL